MTSEMSFPLKAFQSCTVQKAVDELFKPDRKGPRRFLIADEVGLGKTIVAKHIINHLRAQKGKKVIIYVSSSLDITKQNREKLVENHDEIVHADRIVLLYEKKPLNKHFNIISMTPDTSLNLGRSLGSAQERKYIAAFIRYKYRISSKRLADIFHGNANQKRFLTNLKAYKIPHHEVELEKKICKRLESINIKDGINFKKALGENYKLDPKEKRMLIQNIRICMAEVILGNLKPSLVIFDEFQKFGEITETDKAAALKHPLGKILLSNETPTMLLSATPYHLYSENDIFSQNESGSHYSDLKKTFAFLSGSTDIANSIVKSIHDYGNRIQSICDDNAKDILNKKEIIQKNVMKYMSRAERINFEGKNESGIETLYMSDKYDGGMLTKENILEFLRVSQFSNSSRNLLTYWKSGVGTMSYMEMYKLVKGAMEESVSNGRPLVKEKSLYTKLKKHPGQHLKVKYLFDDLLKNGEAYSYLWVPPIKPYYPGDGIFTDKRIASCDPKKGLIFSSWAFVPKMVASELGAMRKEYFKPTHSNKEIKPSGDSWARLFFPSSLLANSLTHRDFSELRNYSALVNRAKSFIENELVDSGFEVIKKGKSLPAHAILSHLEFHRDKYKADQYKGLLSGNNRWRNFAHKKDLKGQMAGKGLPIFPVKPQLKVDKKTLRMLAETAISSPSVCFLRGINQLRETDIDKDTWLLLSSFCFYEIRSFVNRSGHIDAIMKVGKGSKPVSKAVYYFKSGNFQSVVDEYLYQIFSDKSDKGVIKLLTKLSHIFGPIKAHCQVNISERNRTRVQNDIVCCFGDGVEESKSRDANREAFNSPFWPFVLATTSVGQEGLDFHLYCRDIYHWNLPKNPVDLEQREGRINRFNNFMIRKNIVSSGAVDPSEIERRESIWSLYLAGANKHAISSNRYNLGISPNWVYSPNSGQNFKFRRHVMDLPCSNDRNAYIRLMEDLDLYRLALGQPNQREFMDKLRCNTYYKSIDHRGITLNFFPHNSRNRDIELEKYFENEDDICVLLDDCSHYLDDVKHVNKYDDLERNVKKHINNIDRHLNREGISDLSYRRSVSALYYFLDPFDDKYDRDPVDGFRDDIKRLEAS